MSIAAHTLVLSLGECTGNISMAEWKEQ